MKLEQSTEDNYESYSNLLSGVAELRGAIDRFFEEVMVMDKDENVMKNRLAILAALLSKFKHIGNLALLEISAADSSEA